MKKENRNLEYKEILSNSFLKTVSAFSNYEGGKIVFGVKDNLEVTGISDPIKLCLDIENKINDCIEPNPSYYLYINDLNDTVELIIEEGYNKPYFYNNKVYKRNNTSTIEVDKIELKRLILESSNITYDQLKSSKQDLEFNYFSNKVLNHLNLENFNNDTLKTFELYNDKTGYNIAANLLSDNNTFKGVDVVVFGDNINEILDRKSLNNMSIIKQFDEGIKLYETYYIKEKIEGKKRIKIERIPSLAFREALSNALVHKTYDIDASILIRMFKDKVEIISPGGLVYGVSEDDYLNGQISIFRNPIIGNIFFRLNYIEKLGTGIMRINKSYKNFSTKPKYKINNDSISIELPCIDIDKNLNNEEYIIISCFDDNKILSRKEIDKKVNFNKDKTIRIINKLLDKDILEKIGTNKDIRYKLK